MYHICRYYARLETHDFNTQPNYGVVDLACSAAEAVASLSVCKIALLLICKLYYYLKTLLLICKL